MCLILIETLITMSFELNNFLTIGNKQKEGKNKDPP